MVEYGTAKTGFVFNRERRPEGTISNRECTRMHAKRNGSGKPSNAKPGAWDDATSGQDISLTNPAGFACIRVHSRFHCPDHSRFHRPNHSRCHRQNHSRFIVEIICGAKGGSQ
jgi:hypothetical protein